MGGRRGSFGLTGGGAQVGEGKRKKEVTGTVIAHRAGTFAQMFPSEHLARKKGSRKKKRGRVDKKKDRYEAVS